MDGEDDWMMTSASAANNPQSTVSVVTTIQNKIYTSYTITDNCLYITVDGED